MDDAVSTGEDDAQTTIAVASLLSNDTDAGTALSLAGFDAITAQGNVVTQDASGNLVLDIGNNYQSLATGQTATDSFTYTIMDTVGATATATVNISINGLNDDPVATDDAASVQEDLALTTSGNVLTNDSDVDQGTVLSVANAGTLQGNYGSLVLNADGNYTYALDNASLAVQSLAEGQNVTETFTYQASDGITTTPATLTVTITGSNDAPVAAIALPDRSTLPGTTLNLTLPADTITDIDQSDTLTWSASLTDGSALPAWLTFDAGSRTFSGTPADTHIGKLNLTITATDPAGASASVGLDLHILPTYQVREPYSLLPTQAPCKATTAVSY